MIIERLVGVLILCAPHASFVRKGQLVFRDSYYSPEVVMLWHIFVT
jgi:hypothetical protein